MVRYTISNRILCWYDCYKALLSGNCVSASRVFSLLIGGNIYDGYDFANLAIAGSRFSLSASSESREISNFSANLGELVCESSLASS